MSKPSNKYPSERKGGGCGHTWSDPISVSGRLSASNSFGEAIKVDLPRVAEREDLRMGWQLVSYATTHEKSVRKRMEERLSEVEDRLNEFRPNMQLQKQFFPLKNFLTQARGHFQPVDIIHEKWNDKNWSLSKGDGLADFDSRCKDNPGKMIAGGFARCPTLNEQSSRVKDRMDILGHFVAAAHLIRCAEYWTWRVELYRRARIEFLKTPQGGAPGGLALPPGAPPKRPNSGIGGLSAGPQKPVLPPPTEPDPNVPESPPEIGPLGLPDPGPEVDEDPPDPPTEDVDPEPPASPPAAPTGSGAEPPEDTGGRKPGKKRPKGPKKSSNTVLFAGVLGAGILAGTFFWSRNRSR